MADKIEDLPREAEEFVRIMKKSAGELGMQNLEINVVLLESKNAAYVQIDHPQWREKHGRKSRFLISTDGRKHAIQLPTDGDKYGE